MPRRPPAPRPEAPAQPIRSLPPDAHPADVDRVAVVGRTEADEVGRFVAAAVRARFTRIVVSGDTAARLPAAQRAAGRPPADHAPCLDSAPERVLA